MLKLLAALLLCSSAMADTGLFVSSPTGTTATINGAPVNLPDGFSIRADVSSGFSVYSEVFPNGHGPAWVAGAEFAGWPQTGRFSSCAYPGGGVEEYPTGEVIDGHAMSAFAHHRITVDVVDGTVTVVIEPDPFVMADWSGNGIVSVQDIFDFLSDYATGRTAVGVTEFVTAWFGAR